MKRVFFPHYFLCAFVIIFYYRKLLVSILHDFSNAIQVFLLVTAMFFVFLRYTVLLFSIVMLNGQMIITEVMYNLEGSDSLYLINSSRNIADSLEWTDWAPLRYSLERV